MRAPVPAQWGLKLALRLASPMRLEPVAPVAEKLRPPERVVPVEALAAGSRRSLLLAARSELLAPGTPQPAHWAAELTAWIPLPVRSPSLAAGPLALPAGSLPPRAPALLAAVPASGRLLLERGSWVAPLARGSRQPPQRPLPAALLPALS